MKLRKKAICIMAGILAFSGANVQTVSAFQEASHYALIQKAAGDLPADSVIKKAIETYPDMAAWGSIGPDLGVAEVRNLVDYAPWLDRYHYYKVGTFATELLKESLRTGDQKKIAFAAGWVSHVSGDLACHGIYVNPECGVYLDNESTKELHRQMEFNAEPYVLQTLGGFTGEYTKASLLEKFSGIDSIPFDMMSSVSQKVYQTSASASTEKLWAETLRTAFQLGVGYNYVDINESNSFLAQNGRKERLDNAFQAARSQTAKLLNQAEAGNYSGFTDRWNLDVGISESPISSLTVTVKTGTKSGAGTDDNVYFGMELKSGAQKTWLLDKAGYNDFENGDVDEYYLYLNDNNFTPNAVKKVWIEKKKVGFNLGEAWYLDGFDVNVNGTNVTSISANTWLKGNTSVEYTVDWSGVKNISDPAN